MSFSILSNIFNGKKAPAHFYDTPDMDTWYEYEKEAKEPTPIPTVMDMDKNQLINYALDMYGMKLSRKMTEGNMVKAIYEQMHGQPIKRVYKKRESK